MCFKLPKINSNLPNNKKNCYLFKKKKTKISLIDELWDFWHWNYVHRWLQNEILGQHKIFRMQMPRFYYFNCLKQSLTLIVIHMIESRILCAFRMKYQKYVSLLKKKTWPWSILENQDQGQFDRLKIRKYSYFDLGSFKMGHVIIRMFTLMWFILT